MSSQKPSQQQQPFRFWFPYWASRAPTRPTPQRTPFRVPTPAASQQQPQSSTSPAPAAARKKSPSPSPSPSSSSSPSPSLSPSPSKKSSRLQNDQKTKQQLSPSRPATKPASPSREPSQPKATPPPAAPVQQPKVEETSQLPSATLSSDPIVELTMKPSPLESQTPEQAPAKPIPAETDAKPIEKLETEPTPADLSQENVLPESEHQPRESVEEKPKTILDIDKHQKLDHKETPQQKKKPDIGNADHKKLDEEPKSLVEEKMKPDLELKQEIQTLLVSKLEGKPDNIPDDQTRPDIEPKQEIQTSLMSELEGKLKSIPDDKTRPDIKQKQDMQISQMPIESTEENSKLKHEKELEVKLPETLQLGSIPEESQMQPEIYDKPKRLEELSIIVDDEPTRRLGTRAAEQEKLKEQEKVNGKEKHEPKGKVSQVSITTSPWTSNDGDRANFQKEIRDGLSKLVQKMSIKHSSRTGDDQGVSIITLAGKNKGATMLIGNEGIYQKGSMKQEKAKDGATSDEARSKDAPICDMPIAASVNSNVQSINNSVLNESKCEERNPGVHLVVSTKPTEPVNLKGKMEPLKTQKAASSIATPQKLTYEPTIRRRCLRGLFMEPSEDDLEDTQKPRRHGCRFSCEDKNKGKDNGEGTSKPNSNGKSQI